MGTSGSMHACMQAGMQAGRQADGRQPQTDAHPAGAASSAPLTCAAQLLVSSSASARQVGRVGQSTVGCTWSKVGVSAE